jgi:IS1 family transposase
LGSQWDHILLDPESKLVVSLVVGRRTTETALEAFLDFYERTDGRLPELITTDEYAPYASVILDVYGVLKEDLELTEAEKEEFGWEEMPPQYFPVEIGYATVHKGRERGRVVRVEPRIVFGTEGQVAEALDRGTTSATVNTSYVERFHGTNRHFNARKARKVYTFSKDLAFHVAVTWLCVAFYNFGWTPRTLRERITFDPPRYRYRTPAMAAGLTAEPWSWRRILTYPIYRPELPAESRKRRRRKKKK